MVEITLFECMEKLKESFDKDNPRKDELASLLNELNSFDQICGLILEALNQAHDGRSCWEVTSEVFVDCLLRSKAISDELKEKGMKH